MAETSTLARPYARAAFEYAAEHATLGQWSQELHTCALVVADPRVAAVLDNPALAEEAQAKTVIDLCGDTLGEPVKNFLQVLAGNKRLALLPEIREQFELFKAEQEKTVEVEVISAFELHDALTERIARSLQERLKREIKVSTSIDRELLGGVLIKAGDTVIDGSVRGRLNKLAEAMHS